MSGLSPAVWALGLVLAAVVLSGVVVLAWPGLLSKIRARVYRVIRANGGDAGDDGEADDQAEGPVPMGMEEFQAERMRLAREHRERKAAERERRSRARRTKVVRRRGGQRPTSDRPEDDDGELSDDAIGADEDFVAQDEEEAFDPSGLLDGMAGEAGGGGEFGMDRREVARAMRRRAHRDEAEARMYRERVLAQRRKDEAKEAAARRAEADAESALAAAAAQRARKSRSDAHKAYTAAWGKALETELRPAWPEAEGVAGAGRAWREPATVPAAALDGPSRERPPGLVEALASAVSATSSSSAPADTAAAAASLLPSPAEARSLLERVAPPAPSGAPSGALVDVVRSRLASRPLTAAEVAAGCGVGLAAALALLRAATGGRDAAAAASGLASLRLARDEPARGPAVSRSSAAAAVPWDLPALLGAGPRAGAM